jgi:hypothetical protein
MGGGYGYDDDNAESTWYSDTMTSLSTITEKYKNVDTYFIDGNGHCTFGLYYGIQEDGFDDWAGDILEEQNIVKHTSSSVPLFLTSVSIGIILGLSSIIGSGKKRSGIALDSKSLVSKSIGQWEDRFTNALSPLLPFAKRFEKCPITSGYFTATTIYFLCMIFRGFDHPLNNPSLGPKPTTLDNFGIMNPTMIVEEYQFYRFVSSSFLCSGILTYLILTSLIFKVVRHVENVLSNIQLFAFICCAMSIGINLIYSCFGSGASCSSLALTLGLSSFSNSMNRKFGSEHGFVRSTCGTIFLTFVACILFSYNSWILICSAIFLGFIFSQLLHKEVSRNISSDLEDSSAKFSSICVSTLFQGRGFIVMAIMYVLMFLVVICQGPNPSEVYKYPALTGCRMMYSLDLGAIADDFGERRRQLGNDMDFDGICAQFCVPNLVEKPFYYGVRVAFDYSLEYGQCESISYDAYVASHTMTYFGYDEELELYYPSDDNN